MTELLIFQGAGKSLTASKVALEYLGFLPYILVFGAVGFHFFVLPRKESADADSQIAFAQADRGAAFVGVTGALLILISYVLNAVTAARTPGIIDAVLNAGQKAHVRAAFGALLILTFALVVRRIRGAWPATAVLAVAFALRDIVTLQWTRLVNPMHEVGAGLWLGTLLVLLIAGLPAILGNESTKGRHQLIVADLVVRFSPLALGATALLVLTGVVTSWLHLKYLAALWTTPYGFALDAKLGIVLVVVAFGAWNWRRLTPRLNAEEAAGTLRRSSTIELIFAALVLLITAILVSLPSPKLAVP